MRRITLWFLSTVTVLVLLFSYRTSTSSTAAAVGSSLSTSAPTVQSTSAQPSATSGSSSSTSGSSGSISSGSSSSSGTSGTSGTFTGDAASTQWGTVQVRITVVDGKITRSETVQAPSGNPRDEQINATAVPIYDQEVVSAQTAGIDVVSGATVTWDGYTRSLQSAIDQAHL